jgi:hypothetical protein
MIKSMRCCCLAADEGEGSETFDAFDQLKRQQIKAFKKKGISSGEITPEEELKRYVYLVVTETYPKFNVKSLLL